MKKLLSVDEFAGFRRRILSERQSDREVPTLVVSAGTCGQASGSNDIIRVIKRHILKHGLQEQIRLRITGCQGFCEMDPCIVVEPGRHFYPKLSMEAVPRVIDAALKGHVDEELIYTDPQEQRSYHSQDRIPFFRGQTRTILGENEKLDPIRILDYVEQDGYAALELVLRKSEPEWIIREVQESGIRGRGGAGFPTGNKWKLARASGNGSGEKYIVCNADEGDPGAYMDRALLEGNPHAIIEGILIGGLAIGATQGIIYVRAEYPLAIKHALIALRQARDLGLLGKNILGTGVDFDIEIVRGAGAFVCGEETALIKSIEGFMGEPRQRPPYPIVKGIWGHPTCINNVETLANIPVIIRDGSKEFAKVGVPGNTGTKIFSLVGKIKNTGLVEVPLGIKISEVVYDIGGGAVGDARIKAVQTGGPSGGCIPADMFDLPIDYDSLAKAGSIMGSGGMIVMDEDTCMVDVARYFMSFLKDESCGKCFTCRKGTQRMYEILDDVTKGRARLEDLDLLEELALVVRDTTMCGLGQSAPNPVLSALRYFRHEFERHIIDKRCDAFVCSDLVGAPCQSACPLGTEAWRYVAHIQRGEYEEAYRVIRDANPFPSVCARVCHHPCEDRCRVGTSGGEAVAIRALKRFVTDRVDPSTYTPAGGAPASESGAEVAVIGSGPAGLTAAYYLSMQGHAVTVYEALCEPGGMLRVGIPEYRYPRELLEKDLEQIRAVGVKLCTNSPITNGEALEKLASDYDAVFVATGAHEPKRITVPGSDLGGVHWGIEFLRACALGQCQAGDFEGEVVVVVGGGNVAVDAARVVLRLGADDVCIVSLEATEELPAYKREVEEAEQEGISFLTRWGPKEIRGTGGRVAGLVLKRCTRVFDEQGNFSPTYNENETKEQPAHTVILAIGQDPSSAPFETCGLSADRTIAADDKTLSTKKPGVYAGGDVVTGPNTVVDAIAAGKRAAEVIDRYLQGTELRTPAEVRLPRVYVEPATEGTDEPGEAGRAEPAVLPVASRKRSFAEVEQCLTVEAATCEARRCLRCDLQFTQPEEDEEECAEHAPIGAQAN